MAEILGLEGFALAPSGPTVDLSVAQGEMLAIVGPGGGGKSQALRVFAGQERPARGSVRLRSQPLLAVPGAVDRRAKPQSLARRGGASSQEAARATEVLIATHLWEVRQRTVGELSPSQVALCELIEPLTANTELLLLDGQLDRLDPWALASVMKLLQARLAKGGAVVVATNRPDIAGCCDALVVFSQLQVRFAGTVRELLRSGPPQTLEVATDNQPGVRALVEPFALRIDEIPGGLVVHAEEGQALAAKLLAQGYGDVRFVVIQRPTLDEALRAIV